MPVRAERTVGYGRVSTEEQAREGYGLDAQRRRIADYCAAHGWTLAEVYADEGLSGKAISGRPALLRLLEDAEHGHVGRLVFWKIDRLSRRTRDLLEVCDRLEAAGVELVCIQEPVESSPIGRFQRTILAGLAQWERETIIGRIREGLGEKARQGQIVGNPPIGYRRAGRNRIEIDVETAPRIRELFERAASGGYSLDALARWCASVGFRTLSGREYDKNKLRKVLTNPTYAGRVSYHRRGQRADAATVAGEHEAIVATETFETVARWLSGRGAVSLDRPRFGRVPYPLTGIARCGRCGAGMVGHVSGRGTRYVKCGTYSMRGKAGCAETGMRLDLALGVLAVYLAGMTIPAEDVQDVVAELRARQDERRPLDTAKLRGRLDRWRRLFVADEIDFETYRHESAALKAEIAAAEPTPLALPVERAALVLADVGRTFADVSASRQRQFLAEVFATMTVIAGELTEIVPRPDFAPLFAVDRRARFGTFERAPFPGGAVYTPERTRGATLHTTLAPALRLAA